jgi:hypothetical protein
LAQIQLFAHFGWNRPQITKPIDIPLFVLRIRAVLRRRLHAKAGSRNAG